MQRRVALAFTASLLLLMIPAPAQAQDTDPVSGPDLESILDSDGGACSIPWKICTDKWCTTIWVPATYGQYCEWCTRQCGVRTATCTWSLGGCSCKCGPKPAEILEDLL